MTFLKSIFKIFLLLILIGGGFLGYAHFEYGNIKVVHLSIKSKDIPASFDGKKILFIADFQLDTEKRFHSKQMQKIVDLVNREEKDMILLGGDYTNFDKHSEQFFEHLKDMQIPELGGFAILGNHDYSDKNLTIEGLKNLGFQVLNNTHKKVTIGNESIFIAGVEDYWFGQPSFRLALQGVKKDDFAILLNHNPDYFEKMKTAEKEKMDFMLSGHTHGGQITFFGKILYAPIKWKEKYGYGEKEYDGNKMYITSGLGGTAFGMFIRFFAQPEVVMITLEKQNPHPDS